MTTEDAVEDVVNNRGSQQRGMVPPELREARVVTNAVQELFDRYRVQTEAEEVAYGVAVTRTLETCETVAAIAAKGKRVVIEFRRQFRIREATFSQKKAIGERSAAWRGMTVAIDGRQRPAVDFLPYEWTKLRQLCALEDAQIKEAIETGTLTSQMTRDGIDLLVSRYAGSHRPDDVERSTPAEVTTQPASVMGTRYTFDFFRTEGPLSLESLHELEARLPNWFGPYDLHGGLRNRMEVIDAALGRDGKE